MKLLSSLTILTLVIVYTYCSSKWMTDSKRVYEPMNFFNRQAYAFLSGQISLVRPPPRSLLNLVDPYEPSLNAPLIRNENAGLWDLSLYNGKLYMYFGVGPVISLFLPYRVITGGESLPPWIATFIFCIGAILFGGLTLSEIKKMCRGPDRIDRVWFWGGLLLLGLGAGLQFLLIMAAHYEIAVAGGVFFTLLSVWLILSGVSKSNLKKIVFAGIALGFGIACRPHLVLTAPFFVLMLLRISDKPKAALAALCLPVGAIGLSLLLYNQVRFNSPLEFGTKYQLGIYNAPKTSLISTEYFFRSGYLLLFQKINFDGALHRPIAFKKRVPKKVDRVENHFREKTAGIFWLLPLAIPCLILLMIPRYRSKMTETCSRKILAIADSLTLSAAVIVAFLCLFSATLPRYLVDVLPLLSLGIWITVLPAFRSSTNRNWVGTLVILAVFYSALAWTSITSSYIKF